jgi:hypothetical protein
MLRRSLIDNRRNSDLLRTSMQSTAYMAPVLKGSEGSVGGDLGARSRSQTTLERADKTDRK